MVKGNNVLPSAHFRKEWDLRVKTWFNQPHQKERRRVARKAKAAAIAPRPVEALRPVVRGQTVRYNGKVRAGRGFSLQELKAAGISANVAKTIGIAVDHRRANHSQESLAANVERIKAYLAKVVVANKGSKSVKVAGVASKPVAEVNKIAQVTGAILPISQAKPTVTFVKVTDELKKNSAFRTLRQEWINARLKGKRDKKAAEAAKSEDAPKADAE